MNLERLYKALADESRLRLLKVISTGPYSVAELQEILQMGQSRVSRHLKILLDAGLASVERQGTWCYWRVRHDVGEPVSRQLELIEHAELSESDEDESRRQRCLERRRARAQAFHQKIATSWSKMRGRLLGDGRVLEFILGQMNGSKIVADLGCGNGEVLAELAARAERAIGVDASSAMLAEARNKLADRLSGGKCELRLGELEHLPLRDAEADAAVMLLVLHHVAEPPEVLGEVRRVLRPGGRLALCDFQRHSQEWMREEYGDQWLGFSAAEVSGFLLGAGFEDIQLKNFDAPLVPLQVAVARVPGRQT